MAAERRDGPAGQGAVSAHQEAGHGPAGREGQEGQGQRGALRERSPLTHQSCAEDLLDYKGNYSHTPFTRYCPACEIQRGHSR